MDANAVVFSKGINFNLFGVYNLNGVTDRLICSHLQPENWNQIRELLEGGTEFHVDMNSDVKKNIDPLLYDQDDVYNDADLDDSDDDNNVNEVLKDMEKAANVNLLALPEYHNFDELSQKMTDCMSSGDVKMLVMEEGDGPLVPPDAIVTLHYAAYWEKEKVPFDTTLTMNSGEPMKCRLGIGNFLSGLEVGLAMVKGPKAVFCLLLTPKVTWGKMGVMPRIKPETALFIVNLMDVQDVGAVERFNSLPSDEQKKIEVTLTTVTASNSRGKDSFARKRYTKALTHYLKSLSVLQLCSPNDDEELKQVKQMLTTVYTNLAVCYLKLNRPEKVLAMCDDMGRVGSTVANAKCLYLYGRAFQMQGKYDEAMEFYMKSVKVEPNNKDTGKAMADLNAILCKSQDEEKAMWRKVFDQANINDEEKFTNLDPQWMESIDETCREMYAGTGCSRFHLSNGLSPDEVRYLRMLIKRYDKLMFVEDNNCADSKYVILKKN